MKSLKIGMLVMLMFSLSSCWQFNRDQKLMNAENDGKSILSEAEYSKKAKVEEAKADEESATILGRAVIVRAKADSIASIISANTKAKVIEIEAKAIEGKKDYMDLKRAEAMYQYGKFIYIPTEAGMPITETNRLNK